MNFWQDLGKPRLKKSTLQLRQFDGTIIKTLGTFKSTFETKNRFEIIPITVIAYTKDHGLLGIDVLKVDTSKLLSVESEKQEIGLLKRYKASFRSKENYHPRYIQARQLHTHILPIAVSKLKEMIQQGILEKFTHRGSNWTSPIFAIKKTDGDIRICSDYKIGINHQICLDSFLLPNIETASHKFANMKHFAKIDLKLAYNQIEIDDKFKVITTLNTPMRLLRWSHLLFGIKTVNHIFQRATEKILLGKVDNIIIHQDNICLGSCTRKELKNKTEQVLQGLKQAGMTINREKCKLDSKKISYLGYQISREGISLDKRLTNKIAKMEKPMNKKELESLGLINFYSRYLPRYSELIEPFVEMQNKAFEALKKALTSKLVIKIFNSKKEVTLTTDVSEHTIAAVVS